MAAVAEREDLRGRPDAEIFAAATAEGRAVVTEDVRDFAILVRTATELDESHAGVIFTTVSRHPRVAGARDALVRSLAHLLEEHSAPNALEDAVIWL